MPDIWKFLYEDVVLIDSDGKKHVGRVVDIAPAEDTEDDEDNLTLATDSGSFIGFFPHEIQSIELRFPKT